MGGVLRERGPDLLAGDHILIAVAHSARAQGREIGAGIRFGIALAPDLFARQRAWQVMGLLLRRAITHQHRADHDDALVRCARHAPAFLLFGKDHELVGIEAHTAVLNRPRRRRPAARIELRVPVTAFNPAQARRWIAHGGRIIGCQPAAHSGAEGIISERIPIAVGRSRIDIDLQRLATVGGAREFAAQGHQACTMFGCVAVARHHHQGAIEIQTDITIVGVTDGAMQLHCFTRNQQRGMTSTVTGTTRGTRSHRSALFNQTRALRHHRLGEPQLQIHIDHAVLYDLKAADGDAELLACGEVVAGHGEQGVTDTEQIGARRELNQQARVQRAVTRHFVAAEQARCAIG